MKNTASALKEDLFILILIVVSIPIVGEFKFFPLNSTFRVSFSPVLFLFFLFWIKKLPIPLYGVVAGIFTVIFRVVLDCVLQSGFEFHQAFLINSPAFFYYLVFSCLFYLTKINNLHNNPLLMGTLAACIDILSSTCELVVRFLVLRNSISVYAFGLVSIVAIIRSFFVLGFFNIIKLNEVRTAANQQKEQNRYMLLLISNLYAESVQLKKSLTFAENITRDCYTLYESFKTNYSKLNRDELSQSLLKIAGQVHEIKKDNQRIYSGLSKMILSENSKDYMNIEEICNIIVDTNKKYSLTLGKSIDFSVNIAYSGIPDLHIYTVLSLVNNLVSNSIESIENTGTIKIYIGKVEDFIKFQVSDNGIGIPEKKKDLIFKPGYTTKYNKLGKPSTGIGLSYVKQIVTNLKGRVMLESASNSAETTFTIELPIKSLIKEG
ncbi:MULTISPECIES: sensor histidine kinase [Clostridium]|uniref:histidine kinase n=3 Tax=Clostridium TaxID=1485 RepID=D8GJH9_CLOLD|nr:MULTISPECIES: sensor histidine kinase [Clostridium]ADK15140.1 sensor histidine kinase [Clostridium ljungdahlii DSM 13528]AGY74398.1 sensor histidine kinase [Clostridium autoethanogenum DSM 10061]ALU34585.1 Histidine kinase [Clostridium autoethanogenum DSM 10061]OAA88617.1 Sensor histidine kinase GlnK [Clostridium ljungdahlii DSM 13528]OAA95037.1 Sensor histidine kinase GlnK [Clostridium coskatii]